MKICKSQEVGRRASKRLYFSEKHKIFAIPSSKGSSEADRDDKSQQWNKKGIFDDIVRSLWFRQFMRKSSMGMKTINGRNIIILFHLREHNYYGHLNVFHCSFQLKNRQKRPEATGAVELSLKMILKCHFHFTQNSLPFPKHCIAGMFDANTVLCCGNSDAAIVIYKRLR